ncbi:Hydroxyisourate hydrolase [Xylariaceae sp. FL0255]|nr:Hydroxyisourate hydrolase [Xylariaceae sp. FL0255]
MAADKDAITCHILDTTKGKPAKGIRVKLEGGHTPLKTFESLTDDDGRVKSWLPYSSATASGDVPTYTLDEVLTELAQTGDDKSTWTLRFDTGAYFEGETFFPEVIVTFVVTKDQHYHVPLLLSPYSYSTYRGS